MRVLWLSHLVPYPPTAGVMMRSFHLLKALAMRSEVHFATLVQPSLLIGGGVDLQAALDEAESRLREFCASVTIVRDSGFEASSLRYRALARSLLLGKSFTAEWARSVAFRHAVRRLVVQVRPDVVHLDTISLALYQEEAATAPVILNHHNIESQLMLRRARDASGWIERFVCRREARLLYKWERQVCRGVASNLVCSELDGDRLREHVPDATIAVVPNCLPVPHMDTARSQRDPFKVSFVGTMNWRPNAEAARYLVDRIWPLIRERDARYQLHIVGRYPARQLTDAALHDERVFVPGFVESTEEVFLSSGVFACPITDGGGTKLKLIEAMAYRLPIVAHPIACEGLGLVHGKSVIHAQTPDQYTDAVHRIAADPALAASLASAAYELFLRTLSVDAVATQFVREYQRISGGGAVCAGLPA